MIPYKAINNSLHIHLCFKNIYMCMNDLLVISDYHLSRILFAVRKYRWSMVKCSRWRSMVILSMCLLHDRKSLIRGFLQKLFSNNIAEFSRKLTPYCWWEKFFLNWWHLRKPTLCKELYLSLNSSYDISKNKIPYNRKLTNHKINAVGLYPR